ncbi:MAG: NAD(P)-dependent oxidoreductase [Oscillospiraceae bacterium]|nr:NAD(P)-dependent oxidoreductase [Oscillospiraceae bacterium]MCR5306766.1 NAD(P)-dependent oxidoreductase [Oscillospiraceae bacterium]
MKIAITGAGGFLGSELLRQLSGRTDAEVTAFTFAFERERAGFPSAENICCADNAQAADFDFSDTDVLINCAFPRNVNDESFAGGLDFLQRVVEKAAADGVRSVINISSQSVYNQKRREAAGEDAPIVLGSKYAVGKYFSELFVNTVCRKLRHTNLRMASLIGAGFNQRITNQFAMKVKNGEQITLTGGDQLFGFLDVRDAAAGILCVAFSGGDWAEAYNLGTSAAYTLLEIAETVHEIGAERGFSAPRPVVSGEGEWQNSAVICTRLYDRFGWKPAHTLRDTVESIYAAL